VNDNDTTNHRRFARRRDETMTRRVRLYRGACLAGLLGIGLAGCATGSDVVGEAMVDPFKYHFYSCQHLADQTKAMTKREEELTGLMRQAERETGGVIVSALAYKTEHLRTRSELRLLEEEARSKNCNAPAKKP
jgi:hypothetical protein